MLKSSLHFSVFHKLIHLDILLLGSDDTLSHEETVILEKLAVLLWFLLALVQQEADHPLLQNVTKLPEARSGEKVRNCVTFEFEFISVEKVNIPQNIRL